MYKIKKYMFFVYISEMFKDSPETWKKNDIHIKVSRDEENRLKIWLKMRDIQAKLGVKQCLI